MEKSERRRGKRLRSWFAVEIRRAGNPVILSMCRNMSYSGALLATAAHFELGERITLSFNLTPGSARPTTVAGRVVRFVEDAEDPDGLWSHHLGVEFDQELPEVEPELEGDRESWSDAYLVELEGEVSPPPEG